MVEVVEHVYIRGRHKGREKERSISNFSNTCPISSHLVPMEAGFVVVSKKKCSKLQGGENVIKINCLH